MHNACKYSSIVEPSMPIPLSSTSLSQDRYSWPVLVKIARCSPAASPRTCFPCASLGLKLGLLGKAQQRGEKRSIMKRSNPGKLGCGLATASVGGEETGMGISGPPQTRVIRVSTEKADLAVGKSVMSFAK